DVVAMNVVSHNRALDMRKGLLKRRTLYSTTAAKERFDYQSLRFFSMNNPHIGAMQVRFTPLDAEADIIVETFVDTSMTNRGILSEGRKRHFQVTKFINNKFMNYVCVKTFQKKIAIGYASHLNVERKGKVYSTSENVLRLYVKKGETVTFTRFFAVHSSIDLDFKGNLLKAATRSLRTSAGKGFDNLLNEHVNAWHKKWEIADIDIRPDSNIQRALRFNIYHILICGNPRDKRVSIPARTLSSEGYRGHIFWDTEIFILPFFIYTYPEIAKNMLYYRYGILPAARHKARESGYKGALFSWESADTGAESTPNWHRDLDGRVIKIHTAQSEHHIVADIAYAVSHYYLATGDEEFMFDAGLEIIFETARFWASRVTYNKRKDTYSIKRVIGPDEFHTNVNDNAFTNVMARWNLVKAVRLYREHETRSAGQFKRLVGRIKLRESEIKNWAGISNRLVMPSGRNGIIEAFDGFFRRKRVRINGLDDNLMPILPKNIPVRQMKRTQFIKQADVLMLFHLFPESYPLAQKKKNFIYYERKTLHKSSLSPSMHALIGWDTGNYAEAFRYFIFSLYGDLENKYGNISEGIHAASLGGNWQVVFHGFAGIRIQDDILAINPHLPSGTNSLRFKMRYKGRLLEIRVSKKNVRILPISKDTAGLKISVYNKTRELKSGKSYTFGFGLDSK
ncbi:MAG: glycosyl hydrolase family 65 protein, partial [Candidatus Omnitrophota bacterium]|nr:glycosyl hydrolase family 65 protein [Candidatus Omnitrophota bacterium]